MPPTSTSTSRTRRVQTRVRLARLQRTPALPVSRTRRSCPPLLGDRALSAHLDLRRALSYLPALPCSAASPPRPPLLPPRSPVPPQGARRARNRMTSRDLAPLPLRRIGRVTDALSLRPVYDGSGREETGGGTPSGRRGYRRNIAATGQGRRAASLAFVRPKGGYTARLAARQDRLSLSLDLFSPFADACIFFSLSLPPFFKTAARHLADKSSLPLKEITS